MKKSWILVGALALSSVIASAKSYDIILATPAMAGNVQLKAGEYKLKVDGTTATFTDVQKLKSFSVPVKIAQAPAKFDTTAVDTDKQTGTDKIKTIELGGSNTQLEFGE
jgi:hypothetical protein